MKNDDFKKFLMDVHGAQYVGTDDNMPENFTEWLDDLSIDDWIDYGNKYAEKIRRSDGVKST